MNNWNVTDIFSYATTGFSLAPLISIDSKVSDQIIEQGTNVTIFTSANTSGVTVCLSADHGELGNNFTCGIDNVTFTWLAESNIRKFNDSSLFQLVNFTSAGSLNVTLFNITNDSFIENARLDIIGVTPDYAENVRLDLGADNIIDWSFWGVMEDGLITSTKFNNSLTTQVAGFNGRGAISNYLKLPKNQNVSSATLNISGGTNDNYTLDYSSGISLNATASIFIFAPVAAYQDETDEFYLFGYCVDLDCNADLNVTIKYDIKGGTGAATLMEKVPWQVFHGGAVYNPGDDLIYVFGGWDGATSSSASNNMYTYDPDLDSWTEQTAMPGQRYGMEYVLMDTDDKIYICGGVDETGVFNSTCFSYDIGDDAYDQTLSSMPDGLELGWGEQLNSTHFLIWGGTRRGSSVSGGRTYLYEVAGDTWSTQTSMPSSYHGVSGSWTGGNVYSYGGIVTSDPKPHVFRYNETTEGWDQLADMIRPNGIDNDMYFDECDEVDNHVFCMGSGGFGVAQNTHEIYWLPNSISVTVADETTPSQTTSGDLTSTPVTITDLSAEINTQLATCVEDSEKYCNLPLIFSNFGAGTITTEDLNITTSIIRVNLGSYNVSCNTDSCAIPIEVTSDSAGALNISNLSIGFLGSSNITFFSNDTDGNSSSIDANIFYSNHEFNFPANIDFLEFIPSTPTSKNVFPFGQTPVRPILNITTLNSGGRNSNFFFYINESFSCVNLYISQNSTKPSSSLWDNLSSYWPFDIDTRDLSGNGNDGIINGVTFNESGQLAGAYSFDGVDDFINIDTALTNSLATTTMGTWAVWVKPVDATPGAIKIIISFSDTDADTFIHLRIKTNGELKAKVTNTGTAKWQVDTDSTVFSDNTWTHVAVVQNGTSPVVYVDGIAVAQSFSSSPDKTFWFNDSTGLDNGRIGNRNVNSGGESNHWDGIIDEVRIYNNTFSASEILELYDRQKNKYFDQKLINNWTATAWNLSYRTNIPQWMWADYSCNFTTWTLWEPDIFLRNCASQSICSEEII